MKDLTLNEIEQVSAASGLGQLITTVSGAALGCAAAVTLFPAVSVAWFGLIPLSLPLAGGFIGGSVGNIIYNVESIVEDYAAITHAAAQSVTPTSI